MDDHRLQRMGALSAALVAGLSVLYALAFLVVTPSAQRSDDTGRRLLSYLAHPAGARIASSCLLVSGLLIPLAWLALSRQLRRDAMGAAVLVAVLGSVAGLATAAHGLGDLL